MNTTIPTCPAANAAILSSADVAGIELRMLPPFIRNNHNIRIWPFPGRAHLYCLTVVVSDAANQLTGLMDLNAFPRVANNTLLPINKTIYYWEEEAAGAGGRAPNQVHVFCSVIKSKEALRDAGNILDTVKGDSDYQDLMKSLSSVVTDVSAFSLVSDLTLQIGRVIGRCLGKVDDRPIGTVVQSFTRLHGDWDKLGITPIVAATGDVDFSFELVIRDNERLPQAPLLISGGQPIIRADKPAAAGLEMVKM